MITFDKNKQKTMSFKLDVKGIKSNLLEYYIRLSSGTQDYGFKGYEENGIVNFKIPALENILKESEINKIKNVTIEIHDKDNKIFLKPFDEIAVFKEQKNENSPSSKLNKDVKINLDEITIDNKNIDIDKKSKISKFLV